jgi:hypothetical protein
MSLPESSSNPSVEPVAEASHGGHVHVDPHSEFVAAIGWMMLGVAILVLSLRMDRLEEQHINPYTVPGLLPALLGILMFVLGALLALRSWRRGGVHRPPVRTLMAAQERRRVVMVIAMCVTFDVVLVGHGLPFWLAAWIFVSTSILLFQHSARQAAGEKFTLRIVLKACAIGLGAGLAITAVFQEIFLVRLP